MALGHAGHAHQHVGHGQAAVEEEGQWGAGLPFLTTARMTRMFSSRLDDAEMVVTGLMKTCSQKRLLLWLLEAAVAMFLSVRQHWLS